MKGGVGGIESHASHKTYQQTTWSVYLFIYLFLIGWLFGWVFFSFLFFCYFPHHDLAVEFCYFT